MPACHCTDSISTTVPFVIASEVVEELVIGRLESFSYSESACDPGAVAVPAVPTVIELVLPVAEIHGRYRFVLTPWDGANRILVEEGLSPDVRGAETAVTCPVPSDLLASGRYYRVELRDSASQYVRTFTFYTAAAPQR